MLQSYSYQADGPGKLGEYNYQLQMGGEASEQDFFVNYRAPVGKVFVGKSLVLSARPNCVVANHRMQESAAVATGQLAIVQVSISAVQVQEFRIVGDSAPFGYGGGNERVISSFHNSFQQPGLGEGIVIPADEIIDINFRPIALNSPTTFYATIAGTENGVAVIRTGRVVGAIAANYNTVLTYSPKEDDFILKTLHVAVTRSQQMLGRFRMRLANSALMNFPYFGMGESTPVFAGPDGYAGYGRGCIAFPLWGMKFYEGEDIFVQPMPVADDDQRWIAMLTGDEQDIPTGGSGGDGGGFVAAGLGRFGVQES